MSGRWRTKSEASEEHWKGKDDDDSRWSRRDDDRPSRSVAATERRGSNRERSPRRRSPRDREGGRRNYRSEGMVYICNIPYDVRWMELKDLVREKAGEVIFVEILEERNGKSKGAAVVEFRQKESVRRCIENLHRFPMKDRLLSVKEIRDPVAFFRKIKDGTGIDFLNNLHGAPQPENRNREDFETYGLSPEFLRQLKIEGPLTNRLPYNVQSGRVYDIFSLAGKVTWVDLQLDKEGRSKGMAVVQYTHPIEAVQAISMLHNQGLFDRVINVRMDRFEPDEKREGELPAGLRGVGMGLGANGAPLGDVSSVISTLGNISAAAPHSLMDQVYTSTAQCYPSSLPFTSSNSYSSVGVVNSFSGTGNYTPSPLTGNGTNYSGPRSILIKNLPLDYTWQIVRDRVQQFGAVDVTEMIAPGCAKITFNSSADAEKARKTLQNTTVEGRIIGVDFLA
uniref:Myelin expression factor 2 n=1 Tax=Syphacia muris TaxID=451379 RepID=A0A0N5AQN7_9BILA